MDKPDKPEGIQLSPSERLDMAYSACDSSGCREVLNAPGRCWSTVSYTAACVTAIPYGNDLAWILPLLPTHLSATWQQSSTCHRVKTRMEFLGLAWPSLEAIGTWGSEPADEISLSVCLSNKSTNQSSKHPAISHKASSILLSKNISKHYQNFPKNLLKCHKQPTDIVACSCWLCTMYNKWQAAL